MSIRTFPSIVKTIENEKKKKAKDKETKDDESEPKNDEVKKEKKKKENLMFLLPIENMHSFKCHKLWHIENVVKIFA